MNTFTRAGVLALVIVLLALPALPRGAAQTPATDPPVLLSPLDGAITTGASDPPVGLPTLRWAPVDGATRYHIQLSASAGFANPLVDADTYATAYSPAIALADGLYYWRVKAQVNSAWGAYAETWSFTKDWSASGAIVPALLSPPQGATRTSFLPEDFAWTPVVGAATYRLEISPDDTFSSISYSATTVKPHHTPTSRLANNTYYWRVIPLDRRGNVGTASATGSFRFDWNLAPTLLGPDDDVAVQFLPRFSWTAVEAARDYRLEISTQRDFSTSVTAYTTDQTDYTPEKNLANDQDYFWRVRASDYGGVNSPWSEVRHFRMKWNFEAQLLTPLNNAVRTSYPYFSWAPIPGVERYQIQIDESTSFASPIADEKIYNALSYAQPRWDNVTVDGDYFWRVRGVDGQGNLTPWSDLRSFRPTCRTSPNHIYPHYYYAPDTTNLPVHGDRSIAWPVFVWDTAFVCDPNTGAVQPPDYYELTVDDDVAFGSPNFQVTTLGHAAAPTSDHPFTDLTPGGIYYWRVRAYLNGEQIGADSPWVMRYDPNARELELPNPLPAEPAPIFPRDGFEAVEIPPVLGWLPAAGATVYRVQVARDADFAEIVDEAVAQFVNYVPWQGRDSAMPFGTYYWRVRRDAPAEGPWSETRHFNLSVDLRMGNPYDFPPPARSASILATTDRYNPAWTYISNGDSLAAGAEGLGALHIMLDRTLMPTLPLNWVIAFETGATAADELQYGIYVDIDHVAGQGATADPLGKPIPVNPLVRPEYAIYVNKQAGAWPGPAQAAYYRWTGTAWTPAQTLQALGGDLWVDPARNAVQVLVPYTALGTEDPAASGSLALTVFTTGLAAEEGIWRAAPQQPSAGITQPAFVSDMLMPLYPFDTPLTINPMIHYDMPALRWRMPMFDSVDGYQVQVARDARFTQLVETWESYESRTWPYFALMPASFQSTEAYEDNESYYWRVRIRHERYTPISSFFDYSAWSPAMRIKLDSRQVENPWPPDGYVVTVTPTFAWDRVDGASGYRLQVDNDLNFSSPLFNKNIDGTSFALTDALPDGVYYWRVAMRRSSTVIGHWTPTMSFVKQSSAPTPLSPAYDARIAQQPTFTWAKVLTPTIEPRLAAPRYRLQVASDPNFTSPRTYNTTATSYTPVKSQSLADGTWYWRVAVLDANDNPGAYSLPQRFYKEYAPPMLLAPPQGGNVISVPTFQWAPIDGAAYYRIQYADNTLFNSPTTATTDNASHTPTGKLLKSNYYWRVQMYDIDGNPGPFEVGRVRVGSIAYLPLVVR